jgi:spermidine synthase
MESKSAESLWFWRPNLIVFVSSACIMVLELVAGRIIAPHVGVSLYTWTSVIGVILAGMSLGNYLGGRLADRYASLRFLGGVFVVAGLTSLGVLVTEGLGVTGWVGGSMILRILMLIAVLFFLPATVLGTISPIVVKLAMHDLARAGRTVGKISAFSTAGSIVGTFATGFWLISAFGTHTVVWGVGLLLLSIGAFFLFFRELPWLGSALMIVAALGLLLLRLGWTRSDCLEETNYFCIKVREEERDGVLFEVLTLDRLVHSYTSVEHPTALAYGYEKTYAELVAYQAAQQAAPLRAFFIGGGGYTFPRYMEEIYPESELVVTEIDPGVTEVAYEYLGLAPDTQIETYNEDARMFLRRPVEEPYDLIFGDAFNDFSVPYHLTTKEFNDLVHAWLDGDGLYIVNIIDGAYGRFLRAYTRTLRQTFEHVYVVPRLEQWRDVSRDTFVIVAAKEPVDMSAFERDSRFRDNVLAEEEVQDLLAEGRPVILTDRYAPVEQMLAPVFLNKTPEE